ncbi:MAG: protein adenylyltransferase SelO family protein [Prochlorococcaceae cyanobacterium]
MWSWRHSCPTPSCTFGNDDLLRQLGLDLAAISAADVEAVYGRFGARTPLLAQCHHGYQFHQYNPQVGGGRSFLYGPYGPLHDRCGCLQDLAPWPAASPAGAAAVSPPPPAVR